MIQTDEKTTCPRHPKVETALRCATCGTLICPKCLVQTPVGSKCRACASQQSGTLFKPSAAQAVAAVVVALAAGAFAGWAVQFSIGYFTIFLSFIYGGFAADMVLRASGRKRGVRMEIITGVCMALGAFGGRFVVGALLLLPGGHLHPPYGVWQVIVELVQPTPVPLLAIAVAIGSAVSRIRYL